MSIDPRRLGPPVAVALLTALIMWAGSYGLAATEPGPVLRISPARVIMLGRIQDGDTLVARDGQRYRLHGVDAPELCQEWGPRARLELADILSRGEIRSWQRGTSYQRIVADLVVMLGDGAWIDASAEMVRRGMAMVDTRYTSGPREAALLAVQAVAKDRRVGQWSVKPLPPWFWRAAHRGVRAPACGK